MSGKLLHVNAATDGLYRVEFPLEAPLDKIRAALAAAGIYFYRLMTTPTGGGVPFMQTRKMLLLK